MTTQNAYLRTRVMTASPAELRLMLFDGAIRFLTQGLDGLDAGDHEAAYSGYSQCEAILVELINALDPTQAPELCEKLSSLYTFMYLQLVESLSEREPAKGRDVLKLLQYERETWVQLMEKLSAEGVELKNGADPAAAAAVNAAAAAVPAAKLATPVPSGLTPPRPAPRAGAGGDEPGRSSLSVKG